ncbi:hypothetical protein APU55_00385 [Campylobacter jejuni]|nr:hypothetical protein [Campylobacter jejuni]
MAKLNSSEKEKFSKIVDEQINDLAKTIDKDIYTNGIYDKILKNIVPSLEAICFHYSKYFFNNDEKFAEMFIKFSVLDFLDKNYVLDDTLKELLERYKNIYIDCSIGIQYFGPYGQYLFLKDNDESSFSRYLTKIVTGIFNFFAYNELQSKSEEERNNLILSMVFSIKDSFYRLHNLPTKNETNLSMELKSLAIGFCNDIVNEKSYENPFRFEGKYQNLDSLIKRMILVIFSAVHKRLNPYLSYLFEQNWVKMSSNKICMYEAYGQYQEIMTDVIPKEKIMRYLPAYYVDTNVFDLKDFEMGMIFPAIEESDNRNFDFNFFNKFILNHIPISRVYAGEAAHFSMKFLAKQYGNEEIQRIYEGGYCENILKIFLKGCMNKHKEIIDELNFRFKSYIKVYETTINEHNAIFIDNEKCREFANKVYNVWANDNKLIQAIAKKDDWIDIANLAINSIRDNAHLFAPEKTLRELVWYDRYKPRL